MEIQTIDFYGNQNEDLRFIEATKLLILDKAPVCIYINGLHPPRSVWVNKYGSDYLGYSKEMYEKFKNYENNADFIHPDDVDIVADLFQIESGEMLERVFRMRAGKDFNYRYFFAKITPLTLLPTGEIDLVLCAAFDISEMKEIELGLHLTIDRLRIENEKERGRLYKYNKQLLLELEQKKNNLFNLNIKFNLIQKAYAKLKETIKIDDRIDKAVINKIIHDIEVLLNSSQVTDKFENNSENNNKEITHKLNEFCSKLSLTEIKICRLIAMNSSTKDIAEILNLSPRTVDTHRYKIRKKLNLKTRENMYFILNKILLSD